MIKTTVLPKNDLLNKSGVQEATKSGRSAYFGMRMQFIAAMSAQLFLVIGFAVPKAYTLATGQVVTLQAMPVDPYDVFRGEFAHLQYAGLSRTQTNGYFTAEQDVYVVLKHDPKKGWRPMRFCGHKPAVQDGQVVLKGKVLTSDFDSESKKSDISVEYGLERLYLPEGKSAQVEREAKDLQVDVAIGVDGDSCIKSARLHKATIYKAVSMLDSFK